MIKSLFSIECDTCGFVVGVSGVDTKEASAYATRLGWHMKKTCQCRTCYGLSRKRE